jgi:hypothetical protein
LETELRQYPDRDFVEYLCDGLRYGFDTMINFIDMPTKECRNLVSATSNPQIVDDLLTKEVKKGFLRGPFAAPPFLNTELAPSESVSRNILINHVL